jgi:hypothetical protein
MMAEIRSDVIVATEHVKAPRRGPAMWHRARGPVIRPLLPARGQPVVQTPPAVTIASVRNPASSPSNSP